MEACGRTAADRLQLTVVVLSMANVTEIITGVERFPKIPILGHP